MSSINIGPTTVYVRHTATVIAVLTHRSCAALLLAPGSLPGSEAVSMSETVASCSSVSGFSWAFIIRSLGATRLPVRASRDAAVCLLLCCGSTGGGAELARCTFAVILSSERMRLHLLTLVLFRSYITNRSNLLNDARI